ncbi:MAG: Response regulator, partial [Bacteroidetes bacterium]|nr:Response regulator [Bacteroidota bacterium]
MNNSNGKPSMLVVDDEPVVRDSLSKWFLQDGYRVEAACDGASALKLASVESAVQALKEGAFDYVTKPVDPDHLTHVVKNALKQKKLDDENYRLREHISELVQADMLIGDSTQMKKVMELAKTVAQTDTTVMIRGESGTGKELIARAIHAHCARKFF